ncbi:MAG: ribonuclease P protein component [Cytophagaceae bacterium]
MFPRYNSHRPFSFSKAEKLTGKTTIDLLFSKGQSIFKFPVKLYYYQIPEQKLEEDELPMLLISVSKRYFKHAVDRNYIKRQIREVYRMNKVEWWSLFENKPAYVGILYTTNKKLTLEQLKKKLYLAVETAAAKSNGSAE